MTNFALEKFNVTNLTENQVEQLTKIENYIQKQLQQATNSVVVIEGAAGTGKSVILTKLFEKLQRGTKELDSAYYGLKNKFTVNHPELLKVYQELSETVTSLKKSDYMRPTSLINQAHKNKQRYDVIVVDEGHLLLSKPEPYIRFKQDNQLSELIKLARVVIVVFDFNQVMQSKMFWNRALLEKCLAPYPHQTFELTMQYRMQAPASVQTWVSALASGTILSLPKDVGHYDLRIFERAADMYATIKQRNEAVGLSRMLATTGFVKRSATEHNVYLDDFNLPWDEYDVQTTPWAERPASINEVGSIYTIQGFDLNYAGVILGPPFMYDEEKDRIFIDTDKVTHREIYKKTPHITDEKAKEEMKQSVMFHVLNILLTRGTRGLYLTAADDKLRDRLMQL